jgi:hypothetical protein
MRIRPSAPSSAPPIHLPPLMSDWQYGELRAARACLADGRLRVRVDGVQPPPGYEVMLAAYEPDPDSTADVQLGLYWKPRTGTPTASETPYTVRAEVDLRGMHAALVRVYHASGYVDLRVPADPTMYCAWMGLKRE